MMGVLGRIFAGIAALGIMINVVVGAYERQPILVDVTGRVLTVRPEITGGEIGVAGVDFTFETATGMTLPSTTLFNGKVPFVQMIVPDGATTLVIGDSRFPLSGDANAATVRLATSPTVQRDLMWALEGEPGLPRWQNHSDV